MTVHSNCVIMLISTTQGSFWAAGMPQCRLKPVNPALSLLTLAAFIVMALCALKVTQKPIMLCMLHGEIRSLVGQGGGEVEGVWGS